MGRPPQYRSDSRATRVALVAVALAAIAWLATGLHAARQETRGSEIVGGKAPLTLRVRHASRYFERARRFNPDTRPILLEAGQLLFGGSVGRALRLSREVLAREPANVYAWELVAAASQSRNPREAERARARIRALSPPVPAAR